MAHLLDLRALEVNFSRFPSVPGSHPGYRGGSGRNRCQRPEDSDTPEKRSIQAHPRIPHPFTERNLKDQRQLLSFRHPAHQGQTCQVVASEP